MDQSLAHHLKNERWKSLLVAEFKKPYFKQLEKFLALEYSSGKTIYPPRENLFAALNLLDIQNVKVVILGQDPYHGPNQAHGLSFSVQSGVRFPPSLRNIFKERFADTGLEIPESGNLESWAREGVLLLNSVLTVEAAKPASHEKKGWETFTSKIIELVNEQCDHVVFILWGAYAQKKAALVDRTKHLVLESVHPSPLSSHRGFFGSKPFTQTNAWLLKNKMKPICW